MKSSLFFGLYHGGKLGHVKNATFGVPKTDFLITWYIHFLTKSYQVAILSKPTESGNSPGTDTNQ